MNGWIGFIAFGVGFLVAQLIKLIVDLTQGILRKEKRTLGELIGDLTRSGGMPSGHSASMAAVSTFMGLNYGFDSPLFMLATVVTLIVVYDAINVRYAVGEQGKALNQILQRDGKRPLRIVEGHTPVQVLVGLIIGIVIGIAVYKVAT